MEKDSSRWADLERVLADRTASALSVLAEVTKYQRYLGAIEERSVQAARAEGSSWEQIADAAGVTRQAAWKRWRSLHVPVAVEVKKFADVEQVGTNFRISDPVDVMLATNDADEMKRVIDFISGLAFATGGTVERVTERHFRLHRHPLPGDHLRVEHVNLRTIKLGGRKSGSQ